MKKIDKTIFTIGELPTSYKVSLTYEEQLMCVGKKIEEIIDFIDSVLEEEINNYINEKFDEIMMDCVYESETETLVLSLENPN